MRPGGDRRGVQRTSDGFSEVKKRDCRQSQVNGGGSRMKRAVLPILAACIGMVWPFWPRPASTHELITTTVLFDREIVRILNRKCVGCHSENNLAFPLTTYEETRPWARAIQEEALRRHMPPWRAVPGYGQFANDNGLTLREFAFIVSWVEGNGPKSAGQTVLLNVAETPKSPGDVALKPDFERWQLGEPDLQRQLATNTIAPGQPDEIRRAVVDLGLASDRWIRALEFKPGDRRVVRAAFFVLQETGQWLGSWTPWYGVTTLPEGTAYRVPAGFACRRGNSLPRCRSTGRRSWDTRPLLRGHASRQQSLGSCAAGDW